MQTWMSVDFNVDFCFDADFRFQLISVLLWDRVFLVGCRLRRQHVSMLISMPISMPTVQIVVGLNVYLDGI